jgi:hypothetical protein
MAKLANRLRISYVKKSACQKRVIHGKAAMDNFVNAIRELEAVGEITLLVEEEAEE